MPKNDHKSPLEWPALKMTFNPTLYLNGAQPVTTFDGQKVGYMSGGMRDAETGIYEIWTRIDPEALASLMGRTEASDGR